MQRLGSVYFPWASRLAARFVVALGGIGVVVGEDAATISSACSKSGWASAYFPWPLRLAPRLL